MKDTPNNKTSDYLLTGNNLFYKYASLSNVLSAGQRPLLL